MHKLNLLQPKPKPKRLPHCTGCGSFTYDLYYYDDRPLCGECAYKEDPDFVDECEA